MIREFDILRAIIFILVGVETRIIAITFHITGQFGAGLHGVIDGLLILSICRAMKKSKIKTT